ncbi:P-loop containing nucleoside triphosphate hydrolase protein [Syncephalastrum racemosum]|uniref:P-loop containing nucleoside triphosphate hydrolase protein n=1 Tax=Syncephalastrum racemosum TaxID=13706 RepID=A0A1X2HDV4_SYNRA|nr:P-loop containing nucleoside triphosphate hydrolase protein [Syncephalastrum racemosum]
MTDADDTVRDNKENFIDRVSRDSTLFHTDSLSESPFDKALKDNLRQSGKSHPFEIDPIQKSYDRPPSTGSYVTATCPATGKTLYFPRVHKAKTKESLTEKVKSIDDQRAKQKNKKSKKRVQREDSVLWVEKYRPRTFMDLLGDQRVNREVLKWVKTWDYCVFGKKPASTTERNKEIKNYDIVYNEIDGEQKGGQRYKEITSFYSGQILLLSGPPGFGKTTLAHIVAKHSEYNVIEINASDDRTGDVVKNKIKSSLEMQAIIREGKTDDNGERSMSMKQKPNLLVIDEIDGASSSGGDSFIKQLIQLAMAPADKDSMPGKKGENKPQPLLRPIICICNDVYAPVLRPLRAIAHHVQFRKIPTLSVAKRLKTICDSEGLDSDLRTLSQLVEMTEGDMRSCLNTLQFIRSRSTSFTRGMLDGRDMGHKDMGKSVFSIWEELFNAPRAQKMTSVQLSQNELNDRYLSRLTESVSASGEYDKIMQGCFESYPHMQFHDVACQKIVHMSEWLNFYDHVNYRTNVMHEHSMYGYLPFPIVNFHRFFAGSAAQEHRIEYPRIDYEHYVARRSFESLVSSFMAGVDPHRRRGIHHSIAVHELVPELLRIISPDLPPVNKHLIKPAQRAVLDHTVQVMLEYGLTFVQERMEDGRFAYVLEPPIEQITEFPENGLNAKSVAPNKYPIRQLISQQIETEIIRRKEKTRKGPTSLRQKSRATIEEVIEKATAGEDLPVKVPTDFFGQPIVKKQGAAPRTRVEVTLPPVTYKFHEGYSKAVRQPMKISELL